eukprot:363749-Chlamydomonas_euryale.AAC.6
MHLRATRAQPLLPDLTFDDPVGAEQRRPCRQHRRDALADAATRHRRKVHLAQPVAIHAAPHGVDCRMQGEARAAEHRLHACADVSVRATSVRAASSVRAATVRAIFVRAAAANVALLNTQKVVHILWWRAAGQEVLRGRVDGVGCEVGDRGGEAKIWR